MMKIVLVDDEQLAIDVLEILLGKLTDVEVVGAFTNPLVVIDELDRLDVDVIFLDMEMGSLHGLEIAEQIMTQHPQIDIVFVTAHPQFALEAFEVNAIDYLLKPVSLNRLEKAVTKLKGKQELYEQSKVNNEVKNNRLFIKSMGIFRLLDTDGQEVKWRTKKAKELFAYLWHHRGNAVNRAHIIEDLWGDLEEGRATTIMHTTVYQLRKLVRALGFENPVTLVNEQYALNLGIDSDFDQLNAVYQAFELSKPAIEKVIELYEGDYLEEAGYFWALPVQQEMRKSLLTYLEKYVVNGESNEAKPRFIEICLEKMTNLDPYNKEYIVLLLDYYGKANKIPEMVAFFERFKKSWIEELGIDIPDVIEDAYKEYIMS